MYVATHPLTILNHFYGRSARWRPTECPAARGGSAPNGTGLALRIPVRPRFRRPNNPAAPSWRHTADALRRPAVGLVAMGLSCSMSVSAELVRLTGRARASAPRARHLRLPQTRHFPRIRAFPPYNEQSRRKQPKAIFDWITASHFNSYLNNQAEWRQHSQTPQ